MRPLRVIYTLLPFLLLACVPTAPQRGVPQIPYDSLRTGDIVFRRGCSYSSYIVLAGQENHNYSHIGIVQHTDSGWCVIHSVNDEPDHPADFDRVKIEKIERFFAPTRATNGEIMHTWLHEERIARMSQQALRLVKDSVRFDASFDTADNNRLYCTELIYFLYKNSGVDITEGRRTPVGILSFPDEIIFPCDIYENKKLKSYYKF